jgi:acetyl esterase/lipase
MAVVAVVLAMLAAACWKPSLTPVYDVTVIPNVVYGQGEVNGGGTFDDLLLDLYVPQVAGQKRFPLVVTIHGGGFNSGSKAKTAFVANQFVQRGYIVAAINYRLIGDDPVPSRRMQPLYDSSGGAAAPPQLRAAIAAMDDIMTALDFLQPRADVEEWQTVLWGSSAGAIAALYVGYAMDDFGIERPPVAGVISNSGGFAGANDNVNDWIEADRGVIPEPGYVYAEGPIFMTHSTGDPVVSYQLTQDIVDRADAVGHPYVRFSVDAVSHGLPDGLFQTQYSPGVSVFQAQVNWLDSFLLGAVETPASG